MANIFYIFTNGQFLGEELIHKVSSKFTVRSFDYSDYSNRYLATFMLAIQLIRFLLSKTSHKKIVHIHYPNRILYILLPAFSKLFDKLIVTYWGSDFYKNVRLVNRFKNNIESSVDLVSFTNESTENEFRSKVACNLRTKITRFGLTPLNFIDDYDENKVTCNVVKRIIEKRKAKPIIMLGTNVSKNQQLDRLITIINGFDRRADYSFIFCFNYGDLSLSKKLKGMICAELDYTIIEEKLDGHNLAALRKNTDILIQVQITDQLSGAMQETLYAGGRVITGSWLPYRILDDNGVTMSFVDSVDEQIINAIESIDWGLTMEHNQVAIHRLSSWEMCLPAWLEMYSE